MNNPLVSIIVPVYNREYSLHKCLDSILSQTHKNLQLICIDDGSTDKSPEICDEYTKKDNRVRVVHIPNGGVSNARNTGIDMAQGEYILFVDSDDYIEKNHIEILLPTSEEDLVLGGFKYFKNEKLLKINQYKDKLVNMDTYLTSTHIILPFANSVCSSCYQKSIILNYDIRFDTTISIAEDALFNLQYLEHCKVIRTTSSSTYCYENGEHDSLVYKYHKNMAIANEEIYRLKEKILGNPLFSTRWLNWHETLDYYYEWKKTGNKQVSTDATTRIKSIYNSPYFRECISYIRKNGSLDQKFETFFMNYYLHPLYKPTYKIIEVLSKIKNHNKR